MSLMRWLFLLDVRVAVRLTVGRRVVALGGVSWEAEDEFITVPTVDDRGVFFWYFELVP